MVYDWMNGIAVFRDGPRSQGERFMRHDDRWYRIGSASVRRGAALCLLGILVSSNAALAQTETVERAVKAQAGRDVRVGVFGNVRPDCTSGQLPVVRLKEKPSNGTVTVKQARVRTTRLQNCLAAEVPAFVAIYRSEPGFSGDDVVELEIIGANGSKQIRRITITVEKPAGTSL
jgi:hypothetical protein